MTDDLEPAEGRTDATEVADSRTMDAVSPSAPANPVTSPIRREIGQVFIPVRDVRRAARWYSRLLGVEAPSPSHEDTIVDLPMEAGPGLALDANAPFTPDGPPRFFWWADDLGAVVAHLDALGVERASDVVDIGSVAFVQLRDPDGNLLMVCARMRGDELDPSPESERARSAE